MQYESCIEAEHSTAWWHVYTCTKQPEPRLISVECQKKVQCYTNLHKIGAVPMQPRPEAFHLFSGRSQVIRGISRRVWGRGYAHAALQRMHVYIHVRSISRVPATISLISWPSSDHTHNGSGKILQKDGERCLHSPSPSHHLLTLQNPLHHTQSIVYWALHLVYHEVIGSSQDDWRCTSCSRATYKKQKKRTQKIFMTEKGYSQHWLF